MPNSVTITPLDGYTGSPTVTFPALSVRAARSRRPRSPSARFPRPDRLLRGFSPFAGALPGTESRERPGERPRRAVRRRELRRERRGRRLRPGRLARDDRRSPPAAQAVTVTASIAPGACSPPSSITVTAYRPARRRHRDAGLGGPPRLLRTLQSSSRSPPPPRFPREPWKRRSSSIRPRARRKRRRRRSPSSGTAGSGRGRAGDDGRLPRWRRGPELPDDLAPWTAIPERRRSRSRPCLRG